MKKIICALLSLILLCSCSAKEKVQVINKGLSFKAHIFCSSGEYICACKISEDMKMTFTVVKGRLLGFTAVYTGDKVSLSYEEKEYEQDTSHFAGLLFTPISEMFRYFENNQYSVEEEDDIYTSVGEIPAGKFTLCVSPAGLPISAEFDFSDCSVEFYDLSVKKDS